MKKKDLSYLAVPEEVLKSIVASTPGDVLVLKFLQRQGECVSATVRGTHQQDVLGLEQMGELVADVWILTSLMFYVFPSLNKPDVVRAKLEAQCEGLKVPERTQH